jgi:hypothetical protein
MRRHGQHKPGRKQCECESRYADGDADAYQHSDVER